MKRDRLTGRMTIYGEPMTRKNYLMTAEQTAWLKMQSEKQGVSDAQFLRDLIDAARARDKKQADQ